MHRRSAIVCTAVAACLFGNAGHGQPSRTRLWDLTVPLPVAELPTAEWVDPACGTNGGPPSVRLESFADFARCRPEAETGLHEVWFAYDDELEYVGRALRDEYLIRLYSGDILYGHLIIQSLLIDDAGMIQGWRIVTDPRESPTIRIDADSLGITFMGLLSGSWRCTDLPPGPGERPNNGRFLKQICEIEADGRRATVVSRYYLKAGQDIVNPEGQLTENLFESSARIDVVNVAVLPQ